ncbi:MAG: hypothetical protein K2P58_02160 [Hyphomonadaceae bacterium]|nr:hypothetical protein [Hyphomonadaceae bacterium]
MAPVLKASFVRGVGAAALAVLIAGCASASRAERQDAPEQSRQTIDAGAVQLETLAPQPLNPGQCGLFLWAQGSQEPAFVFVSYNRPAEAIVRPNGRERRLARTAGEGATVSGVFESQAFSDGRMTLSVDVTFDPERELHGGAVVDRGVLRLRDQDGWETVIPVGGLAACQS